MKPIASLMRSPMRLRRAVGRPETSRSCSAPTPCRGRSKSALRSRSVPYQLVRGLEFFKRREIRDVVAWLRLLKNPRDDEAFLRVVNVPPAASASNPGSSRRLGGGPAPRAASRPPPRGLDSGHFQAGGPGPAGDSVALDRELAAVAAESADTVAPLLEAVLERTGYRRMLAEEADEDDAGDDRLANVEELVTAARQLDDSFVAGHPRGRRTRHSWRRRPSSPIPTSGTRKGSGCR